MKTSIRTFVASIVLLLSAPAFTEEIKLSDGLVVDVQDRDFTFQAFPEFDMPDPSLALWDGDDLVGLVTFVGHDQFPKPFAKYLKQFISDVEKGAKDVVFRDRRSFKSDGGHWIRPYHATFRDGREQINAIYYFYRIERGYQIVMFMIFDDAGISKVEKRFTSVMKTARTD